jgi:hypothetical protein
MTKRRDTAALQNESAYEAFGNCGDVLECGAAAPLSILPRFRSLGNRRQPAIDVRKFQP